MGSKAGAAAAWLLPTLIVLAVLAFPEIFSRQRLLFASLTTA